MAKKVKKMAFGGMVAPSIDNARLNLSRPVTPPTIDTRPIPRTIDPRTRPVAPQTIDNRPVPLPLNLARPYKKGGQVKAKVSSASKRADGIARRGKTRGRVL